MPDIIYHGTGISTVMILAKTALKRHGEKQLSMIASMICLLVLAAAHKPADMVQNAVQEVYKTTSCLCVLMPGLTSLIFMVVFLTPSTHSGLLDSTVKPCESQNNSAGQL